MHAGLGLNVGKFGHIHSKVGRGGQVLMGQTDRERTDDMASGCGCRYA